MSLPSEPTWRARALCADMDAYLTDELFFPHPNSDATDAKEICIQCPVAEACLTYALETRQEFGVWGCMTERERKALLRRRWKQQNKRRKLEAAS